MSAEAPFELSSSRLGALPIVNRFLERTGIDRVLERYLPAADARVQLAPARVIGVVLRNLCLAREPLYALAQWAAGCDQRLLGLGVGEASLLNDDRVGRALEQLFDCDRASLLCELVLGVITSFGIDCSQLHNDSTSILLHGNYERADGSERAGKATVRAARGYSKDHRPDLKQLVWILTVAADGAVPIAHRLADGNTEDASTHIESWDGLVSLLGRSDFLYVADSKLATRRAIEHITARGGRFLSVLPHSRKEDRQLREWIRGGQPALTEAARHPARHRGEPDDVWSVAPAPFRSQEGCRIVLVHSTQKHTLDQAARQDTIARGLRALDELCQRLTGERPRFHDQPTVTTAARAALKRTHSEKYLRFTVTEHQEERTLTLSNGPGKPKRQRRFTRTRFTLHWEINETQLARHASTDGYFPLITNDHTLTDTQLLAAYRYQPNLEKRHHQLKSIQHASPVLLHNPARIEALFTCHFIALLCRCLIERHLRNAMHAHNIPELPLYPEHRDCRAPTATRIFEVFENLTRHQLTHNHKPVQTFNPDLTTLHHQLLDLLDTPPTAYTTQPNQ